MAYVPLATVLQQWQQAPEWQQPQHFLRLLEQWPQLVGAVVAEHAVPVELTSQGVLHVAVASSTWAHHLMFSRSPVMVKIQQTLGIPLSDIRFSNRDWQPQRSAIASHEALPKVGHLPQCGACGHSPRGFSTMASPSAPAIARLSPLPPLSVPHSP